MNAHERERLSAYLDGELPVGERPEVAAHLATCSQCRSVLSEMEALDKRARELPLDAPPGYFDTLPGRVRARVEGLSPARRPAPVRSRRTLPTWTWAAAAALILGVVTPLTLRQTLRDRAPERPASLAVEAHRSAPEAQAPASRPGLEGRLADRADEEAATEKRKKEAPLRAQEQGARAEPEPFFAAAPALPPGPPPAAPKRSGGKADAPVAAAQAPPAMAETRPLELGKDTRGFARAAPGVVAETESLEEKVTGPSEDARLETAMAADAVSSHAAGEASVGGTTAMKPAPAAASPAGEAGRRRLAQADKKSAVDEDTASFTGLARSNAPADAAGWRERREAWRGFVARHPESPHADEARVRVVEAGLEAWRAGADPRDLDLAREDAAAYLARDDAALEDRVRRALDAADRE